MGDCLIKLKDLEDNSIDSIVTDPPYELGFMGKSWDNTGIANNPLMWAECLRVLKPGGYLLSFGGTRTYHRMAVAIEDAGFEVRDMIEWVYSTGFPKSLNIGKALNKIGGVEFETKPASGVGFMNNDTEDGYHPTLNQMIQKGESTPEAKQWEGWGTALKPAHEPICMARKPLAEKTVAENVLKYGTGGINIDDSRVGTDGGTAKGTFPNEDSNGIYGNGLNGACEIKDIGMGRFPANLLHDNSEEVRECFPETGKSTGGRIGNKGSALNMMGQDYEAGDPGYGDSGNASRFFKSIIYQAKSSKSERNKGLDCYLTVKYNGVITDNNKTLCKEENMVAVQLLQKVISEQEIVNFNIDESGVNIMVQCHKDSLSIILTEIKRIIGLKIYNSLMHSLTNESTQVANSEMEIGGNLAESVANLKRWIMTITKGNQELALGASRVVCQMLYLISEEENWKQKTNIHSTVKPTALMEYLIKMVTPKGGVILDPFAGSGSTLVAAKQNGYQYIGIEMTEEYIPIIEARLSAVKDNLFNESNLSKVWKESNS